MKTLTKIVSLVLLVAMTCVLFAACAPSSDPAKAEAALKENGYTVVTVDDKGLTAYVIAIYGEGAEYVINATKKIEGEDDKYESIAIIYYDTKDNAKAAAGEKLDELKKDAEENGYEVVAKQSGKMIYIGTKQAVKDAR